jgi:hypothetical protein
MSKPKVTPPFGYRPSRRGPYEDDPLEQLVLRVTRETVAAGGDLLAVADKLAASVCFECGAPAVAQAAVVPGGRRTVPLCGKCHHWRQPLGPEENVIAALGRIEHLDLSAAEFLRATTLVAMEQHQRDAAAEERNAEAAA